MKKNILRSLSAIIAAAMLLCGALPALAEDKKETVFVMADANGHTDHIVVSERLYNPDGADTLDDVSTLENIENVGGDETFVPGEDGALVWNANGADISYEGTTDAPLPVSVTMTYALDGEAIDPAELAGKSGHLDIEIRYAANQTAEAEVAGERETMQVPFLMATVMLLDEDEEKDDEDGEVLILRIEKDPETDEDIYVSVDDDEVSQAVFDQFVAMMDEEEE